MAFVLYTEYPTPQYVMTGVLSGAIGLLLFLMMVLNRPFVGPLGIEPEPYEASLQLFNLIDQDFQKIAADSGHHEPAHHE